MLLSTPNSFLPDFAWNPMDAAPSYLRVFCCCCSVSRWVPLELPTGSLAGLLVLTLCRRLSAVSPWVPWPREVMWRYHTTSSPPCGSYTFPSHSSEMFPEPWPVCKPPLHSLLPKFGSSTNLGVSTQTLRGPFDNVSAWQDRVAGSSLEPMTSWAICCWPGPQVNKEPEESMGHRLCWGFWRKCYAGQ